MNLKALPIFNPLKHSTNILLLCMVLFCSLGSHAQSCQNTETFESIASDATTFIDAADTFSIITTTGYPFFVDADYAIGNYGWNGTANDQIFIDNSNPGNSFVPNVDFSIKAKSGVFSVKSLWIFPSDKNADGGVSGTVKFTGKLSGTTVFTVTLNSATFPFNSADIGGTDNGYTLIDFSTAALGYNNNQVIDELEITGGGNNYSYMELDDFVWVKGGAIPAVTATAAGGITSTTATLNGTVNANDLSTTPSFNYSHTSSTLSSGVTTIAATPSPLTGSTSTAVSASLTGLLPNTTYYYQVTGLNCGTASAIPSSIMSFTTTSTLPVTWLSTSAQLNTNNAAVINWEVQEEDVAAYQIEESINNGNYIAISSVSSKGDGLNNYTLTYSQPYNGNALFRIKQIDKDGSTSYSTIISLQSSEAATAASIYPNPAVDITNISIHNISKTQTIKYSIVDNAGRILLQSNTLVSIGNTIIPLNIKGLTSGLYHVSIIGETINTQLAFIKE